MQCGVFKPIYFDSFSSVDRQDLSSRSTATSALRCPVEACEHTQGKDWEDKENKGCDSIHAAKIFGNFGLTLNVSVRQPKSFEKASLPFEMDHFPPRLGPDLDPSTSQFRYLMDRRIGRYLLLQVGLSTADLSPHLSVLLVLPYAVTTVT